MGVSNKDIIDCMLCAAFAGIGSGGVFAFIVNAFIL